MVTRYYGGVRENEKVLGRRSVMNRVLAVLGTVALAVTVAACERDRTLPSPSVPDSSLGTVAPITTPPASTAPPSSPAPATTTTTAVPATTAPATTQPDDDFADVTWGGDAVDVPSPFISNPLAFQKVGTYGDLLVYDGSSTEGSFAIRCVVIASASQPGWSESCLTPATRTSFVYLAGADPWIVEVGADAGDVVLTQQPATWAVTTSGCVEPLANLLAAAPIVPAMASGLACAGEEAFLTFGSVLLQPGPVDGGGMLLIKGEEGWNTEGGGTSFDCAAGDDGVDRCALFGVASELVEAVTPLPGPELIPPQVDVVDVRNVTAPMGDVAAGATDIDTLTQAVLDAVAPPDAEVAPTMVRHDNIAIGGLSLLIVDVPAADDSVRSTTWAAWIAPASDTAPISITRAYAWDNCARGLASPGLCV